MDGVLVASMTPSTTSRVDFIHRSDKLFAHALFVCENASCTSWYGDGSGSLESTTNTGDSDWTEKEVWVLTGITGPSDATGRVVDDPTAMAPHPFFYPASWATGYSDQLGLYYSKQPSGSDPSRIYHLLHEVSGWPAAGFNDTTDWAASPTQVSEGSSDSADADYQADHPWAMLMRDGSAKSVVLFAHSQGAAFQQIVQIQSSDEAGLDFGTGSILAAGGSVAVAADGTSATDYVQGARHSRVGWDYIADPIVDAGTDLPFMLFQLEPPAAGACAGTAPDDLGWVDGAWDSGASQWDWQVDVTGGGCPVNHVPDRHDNSIVPLPNYEFKAYVKDGNTAWKVIYWNGSSWVDEAEIEFYYDGAMSGPDQSLVDNAAAIVYTSGGVVYEGMFFQLGESAGAFVPGLDDSGANDGAIVFAQHEN